MPKSPAKIEQIIATGIKDEGMPGFETLLSKDEIRALSEYILAESKSKSINIKKVKNNG
jgi:mono/diheme cytochrome c family protein